MVFLNSLFQIVVSGVAVAPADVAAYASCTMLAASMSAEYSQTEELIEDCIRFLQENEFVTLKSETNDGMTACFCFLLNNRIKDTLNLHFIFAQINYMDILLTLFGVFAQN